MGGTTIGVVKGDTRSLDYGSHDYIVGSKLGMLLPNPSSYQSPKP